MAFTIKAKMEGLDDLIKDLRGAPKLLRRRLRSAMKKSMTVICDAAIQNVQTHGTGALKQSLGIKVRAYASGVVVGIVEPGKGFVVGVPPKTGTRGGQGTQYYPQRIAHLVEKGTKQRRIRTIGERTMVRKLSELINAAKKVNDRFERKQIQNPLRLQRRQVGMTGANRGAMPAKPFLRPAAAASDSRVIQIFLDEINKPIDEK